MAASAKLVSNSYWQRTQETQTTRKIGLHLGPRTIPEARALLAHESNLEENQMTPRAPTVNNDETGTGLARRIETQGLFTLDRVAPKARVATVGIRRTNQIDVARMIVATGVVEEMTMRAPRKMGPDTKEGIVDR